MKKLAFLFLLFVSYAYCNEPNTLSELTASQKWVKDFKEQIELGGIWDGHVIKPLATLDKAAQGLKSDSPEIKRIQRLEPDLIDLINVLNPKPQWSAIEDVTIFQHTPEPTILLVKPRYRGVAPSHEIFALELPPNHSYFTLPDGSFLTLKGIMLEGTYQYTTVTGSINTIPKYKLVQRDILNSTYYRYVYKCGLESDFAQGFIVHTDCSICKGTGKINHVNDGKITSKTTCEEIFKNPVYKESARTVYEKRWDAWKNNHKTK